MTWICHVLRELGISLPVTPELYGDNLSSVYLTANPAFHKRSKHFEFDYHYVRERVALGSLMVKHIPAHQEIADIFTKSLPCQTFCDLRYKLGVDTPPTPRLRGSIRETAQNGNVLQEKTSQQLNGVASVNGPAKETKIAAQMLTKPSKETTPCTVQRSSPMACNDKENRGTMTKACTEKVNLSNQFSALDDLETTR